MIVYSKQSVRIAEVFSLADAQSPAQVDILRFRDCSAPVSGTISYSHFTWQVALDQDPDAILAGMRKRARRKIRAGEQAGLAYEWRAGRDCAPWLTHFFEFFDRFAELRGLPSANRERLETLAASGILQLTRASSKTHGVMVYHAYTVAAGTAHLLHSASLFRERQEDARYIEDVSNANGWLHWQDMVRFRNEGCKAYDFGSWHTGNNPDHLKLNTFKHSFGGAAVPLYFADRGLTFKGKLAIYARKIQGVVRKGR
ncbi:hypothetical protein F183_A26630 [Bryobacterales bacterium F-183]|nr:hypothetical protein F183_A26630 [Bryobacterales bacterium F-183]